MKICATHARRITLSPYKQPDTYCEIAHTMLEPVSWQVANIEQVKPNFGRVWPASGRCWRHFAIFDEGLRPRVQACTYILHPPEKPPTSSSNKQVPTRSAIRNSASPEHLNLCFSGGRVMGHGTNSCGSAVSHSASAGALVPPACCPTRDPAMKLLCLHGFAVWLRSIGATGKMKRVTQLRCGGWEGGGG